MMTLFSFFKLKFAGKANIFFVPKAFDLLFIHSNEFEQYVYSCTKKISCNYELRE